MSGLGKIFVVLNLVFSLVIVGAAAAYLSNADDWKTKFEELQGNYTKATEAKDQAESELQAGKRSFAEELTAKRTEIEDLKLRADEATNQLKSQRVDNQQLRDDVTKINTTLQQFQSTINEITSRNNELVDQNTQLRSETLDAQDQKREAEDNLQRAEDELQRSQDQIKELEMKVQDLEQEKEKLSSILDVAKSSGFDLSSVVAMPEISAFVENVNNEEGFVILSAGADKKVERGYTFQIYREDQYVGEVLVDDVYPDRCAARIKSRVNGAQIMVNDKATTLL